MIVILLNIFFISFIRTCFHIIIQMYNMFQWLFAFNKLNTIYSGWFTYDDIKTDAIILISRTDTIRTRICIFYQNTKLTYYIGKNPVYLIVTEQEIRRFNIINWQLVITWSIKTILSKFRHDFLFRPTTVSHLQCANNNFLCNGFSSFASFSPVKLKLRITNSAKPTQLLVCIVYSNRNEYDECTRLHILNVIV